MNEKFRAFRIHSEGGRIGGRFEDIGLEDLSPGEVVIRVSHSGINYKDALAATGAGRDPAPLSARRRHRSGGHRRVLRRSALPGRR